MKDLKKNSRSAPKDFRLMAEEIVRKYRGKEYYPNSLIEEWIAKALHSVAEEARKEAIRECADTLLRMKDRTLSNSGFVAVGIDSCVREIVSLLPKEEKKF